MSGSSNGSLDPFLHKCFVPHETLMVAKQQLNPDIIAVDLQRVGRSELRRVCCSGATPVVEMETVKNRCTMD